MVIFGSQTDRQVYNLTRNKKLTAFTLAEVLITLVVIGIIAGMTLPAIKQNMDDIHYHTKAKKVYSIMSNALIAFIADRGTTLEDVNITFSEDWIKEYAEHLKTIKECDYEKSIEQGCWPSSVRAANPDWDMGILESRRKSFCLIDGSCFISSPLSGGTPCGKGLCHNFFFDVNGVKGPNVMGRDVYYVQLYYDHFAPSGSLGCEINKVASGNWGYACLSLLLKGEKIESY